MWYNNFMENIERQIANCTKCGILNKLKSGTVKYGTSQFVVVGESPAKGGWIETGNPFYNIKGKMFGSARVLAKLLESINLSLDDIYFTECSKCVIEDRKNLLAACLNCKSFLVETLNKLPCKIIVTMGKCPSQVILNCKIERFSDFVGRAIGVRLGDKDYLVVPIYHTSPLNPLGFKGNIDAFRKLKEIMR